jgi:CRP/FNR family cyclic AMP-dependent transcriptional regulator
MLNLERKKATMLKSPIFRHLQPTDYDVVADRLKQVTLKSGDVLMKEGAVGDCLYFLVSGKVEIRKELPGNIQTKLTSYSGGALIGEQVLVDKDARRTATAVAIEECELFSLNHVDFDDMMTEHPRIGTAILKDVGAIQWNG